MVDSLVAHLAHKFSAQTENVATEGLGYCLRRSAKAREALRQVAALTGIKVPQDLTFVNQEGIGGTVPDLTARDVEGSLVMLIEGKFWAGLTDSQPVAYLETLSQRSGKLLLFMAPGRRADTLWSELVRRTREARYAVPETEKIVDGLRCVKLDRGLVLALASWGLVLAAIEHAAEDAGETEVAADVRQLIAMCDHMDSEKFLPLHSEEVAGIVGRRQLQFRELVDDACAALVATGHVKKVRATLASYGDYHRCMRDEDLRFGLVLMISYPHWATSRDTPIWLGILDSPGKVGPLTRPDRARPLLSKLNLEVPPALFDVGTHLLVPIYLALGVEKDAVVREIVAQVEGVRALLAAG